MDPSQRTPPHGRGSAINPANRFERLRVEADLEQVEQDEEYFDGLRSVPTEYLLDRSEGIVSQNDSPDIPFRYSLNPYRGCQHGCSYCYARPTHEYLGMNAGLDFESKILVKTRAPQLLRDWLSRSSWTGEWIAMSGVTDCYQPCERRFRLTRGCLEVAAEARQAIGIVTKNALVRRDLDVLRPMADIRTVNVYVSVTTLDHELARTMEPRTSTPAARLETISALASAGVPVGVMVAPVIPGLNDHQIAGILRAAAEAGAQAAGFILLRLPLTVEPVFREWLDRVRPGEAEKVLSRIRATRDGRVSDSRFGSRMRGEGPMAEQIKRSFEVFRGKFGLERKLPPLDTGRFRPPRSSSGQGHLF